MNYKQINNPAKGRINSNTENTKSDQTRTITEIIETHLADSLLISKISATTVWTERMPMLSAGQSDVCHPKP